MYDAFDTLLEKVKENIDRTAIYTFAAKSLICGFLGICGLILCPILLFFVLILSVGGVLGTMYLMNTIVFPIILFFVPICIIGILVYPFLVAYYLCLGVDSFFLSICSIERYHLVPRGGRDPNEKKESIQTRIRMSLHSLTACFCCFAKPVKLLLSISPVLCIAFIAFLVFFGVIGIFSWAFGDGLFGQEFGYIALVALILLSVSFCVGVVVNVVLCCPCSIFLFILELICFPNGWVILQSFYSNDKEIVTKGFGSLVKSRSVLGGTTTTDEKKVDVEEEEGDSESSSSSMKAKVEEEDDSTSEEEGAVHRRQKMSSTGDSGKEESDELGSSSSSSSQDEGLEEIQHSSSTSSDSK